MNWGNKIAIFYTFFAISMVSAVIYASMQSFDLVSPSYYAEEIAFEKRIQEIKNVRALESGISIKKNDLGQLEIQLPTSARIKEGKLRFYRPSNASLDKSFRLIPGENFRIISIEELQKGNWNFQVSWTDGEKNYYDERKIEL